MLFLDGAYVDNADGSSMRFRWVKAPTSAELTHLTHTIAQRVGRFLERQGLLERDAENSYLAGDGVERGHWSRPHERPLSVFGLACGYPPRMAGHGTLPPVDVAPHEAGRDPTAASRLDPCLCCRDPH